MTVGIGLGAAVVDVPASPNLEGEIMEDTVELCEWQDTIETRLKELEAARPGLVGEVQNEILKCVATLEEDVRELYITGAALSKRLRKLEAAKGEPESDTVAVPVAVLKEIRRQASRAEFYLAEPPVATHAAIQIIDWVQTKIDDLCQKGDDLPDDMPLVHVNLNPDAGSDEALLRDEL